MITPHELANHFGYSSDEDWEIVVSFRKKTPMSQISSVFANLGVEWRLVYAGERKLEGER